MQVYNDHIKSSLDLYGELISFRERTGEHLSADVLNIEQNMICLVKTRVHPHLFVKYNYSTALVSNYWY